MVPTHLCGLQGIARGIGLAFAPPNQPHLPGEGLRHGTAWRPLCWWLPPDGQSTPEWVVHILPSGFTAQCTVATAALMNASIRHVPRGSATSLRPVLPPYFKGTAAAAELNESSPRIVRSTAGREAPWREAPGCEAPCVHAQHSANTERIRCPIAPPTTWGWQRSEHGAR